MKIYIVYVEWGVYADYTKEVDKTFSDEKKNEAEKYANKMKQEAKKKKNGMKYTVVESELL